MIFVCRNLWSLQCQIFRCHIWPSWSETSWGLWSYVSSTTAGAGTWRLDLWVLLWLAAPLIITDILYQCAEPATSLSLRHSILSGAGVCAPASHLTAQITLILRTAPRSVCALWTIKPQVNSGALLLSLYLCVHIHTHTHTHTPLPELRVAHTRPPIKPVSKPSVWGRLLCHAGLGLMWDYAEGQEQR